MNTKAAKMASQCNQEEVIAFC